MGVANEARDMSMKERLPSKKYMGELRHGSDTMVSTIRKLPSTVDAETMDENRKGKIWSSQQLERPRSMNSVTTD